MNKVLAVQSIPAALIRTYTRPGTADSADSETPENLQQKKHHLLAAVLLHILVG